VRRVFRRISRRAGLSRVNPYVLRNTWATQMLEAGAPLNYVSRALGHGTSGITARIYGLPPPEIPSVEAKAGAPSAAGLRLVPDSLRDAGGSVLDRH